MKILAIHVGATWLRFRLFEMSGKMEREVASGMAGGVSSDDSASAYSTFKIHLPAAPAQLQMINPFADHGAAFHYTLDQLIAMRTLHSTADLDAVAVRVPTAGELTPPAVVIDDKWIRRIEGYRQIAPDQSAVVAVAINFFRDELSDVPIVAVFDSGFHRTIPPWRQYLAIQPRWAEKYGVMSRGFQGPAHQYVAGRVIERMGVTSARRMITCYLGSASSVCAIKEGVSVACSSGVSPTSGLPQMHAAGQFDPAGFRMLRRRAKMQPLQVLDDLAHHSGLAALSGVSGRIGEIRSAAADGDERAQLAFDVFITAVRDFIGAYIVELGGLDVLAFSGTVGAGDPVVRADICGDLEFAGIEINTARNEQLAVEGRIDSGRLASAVWIVPANEPLMLARLTAELLEQLAEAQRGAFAIKA